MMFDREKLREILEKWEHENVNWKRIGAIDELFKEMEAFIEAVLREQKITDGQAIAQLNKSGWMQEHDKMMTFDSLTNIVNGIMMDGDKSISVNVYPYKEGEE